MLGETNWVRNVRADDGRAVLHHGQREQVLLEVVPVTDRPAVIKRYLEVAPGARPHIRVDRTAPIEDFQDYAIGVESLRDLLEIYDRELTMIDRETRRRLKDHAGYRAVQALHGVGPVMASIFVAEIGDISRFPTARHLCSWAGLTPLVGDSDTTKRRGHISKQGSVLVRWAAVEAVARYHGGAPIAGAYRRIAERRGTKIAKVAAARKLLSLVFYGLRDGEIRCLADREAS
jgi:transposase